MPTPSFGFGPASGANGRAGGLNPPAINSPQLNTSYSVNPYLGQALGGLQTDYNNNLQRNVLPGINSGAVVAGGLGGSREGVAQGIAIGDSQRAFANAATGMLGQDYEAQQGRNLQQYQGDQQYSLGMGNLALGYQNSNDQMQLGQENVGLGYAGLQSQQSIAGMNNATQRYGIDANTGLGYAGLQNQANIAQGQLGLGYTNAANQRYGIDSQTGLGYAGLQNQANIAQGQLGLGYTNAANQRYATDQGTSTQRYGIDSQTGLGYAGLTNQMGIAQMNNSTTQRGQDQTYSLGQGANQNQANQIANNYALGQGNLNLGYQNSAQQYNLGVGQNYNQATANNNNYNLGLQQNATTQRGQDANYNLGMTQAAYGRENADHNYNLGLGQLDLNGMQLGANLYNQGVNGAWNPINNANNVYGNYTGFGNSSQTSQQGGGWMGAAGGAIGGAQLANLFSGSSSGFSF